MNGLPDWISVVKAFEFSGEAELDMNLHFPFVSDPLRADLWWCNHSQQTRRFI